MILVSHLLLYSLTIGVLDDAKNCATRVAVPVDLEGHWQSNKTIKTVNYTLLLTGMMRLLIVKQAIGDSDFETTLVFVFVPTDPIPHPAVMLAMEVDECR